MHCLLHSHILKILVVTGLFSVISFAGLHAQDNTVETKPFERPESSLAIPFGVTGSYSYLKALVMEEDEDTGDSLGIGPVFGVNFSYDTWFAGYHRQVYGNVFRIGNKPAEREIFSGLYIDIGSLAQTTQHYGYDYYSQYRMDSTSELSIPVIAVGIDYHGGYGTGTSVRWRGNYTVGYASVENDNNFFGTASYGLAVRIPFGPHAIDIGGDMFAGVLPLNFRKDKSSYYSDRSDENTILTSYVYGVGVTTAVTLGFNN